MARPWGEQHGKKEGFFVSGSALASRYVGLAQGCPPGGFQDRSEAGAAIRQADG